MLVISQINRVLQVVLARYQLQANTHIALLLLFQVIGAIHFYLAVLQPYSDVTMLFRWLDPSYMHYGLNRNILLAFATALIVPIFIWFVRQFYVAVNYGTLKMPTWEKYGMKIIGTLGAFSITAGMLPILRIFIMNIQGESFQGSTEEYIETSNIPYFIGWFSIVLYTCFILPFQALFLVNLQPFSKNNKSSLSYLNFMRVLPIIKVLLCFSNIIAKTSYIELVCASLPILLFWCFKQPIFQYYNDSILRLIIYQMLWILLQRILNSIQGQAVQAGIILVGSPLFSGTVFLLVEMWLVRILGRKKLKTKMLKAVLAMLNNFSGNLKLTALFLMSHRSSCENAECSCKVANMTALSAKQTISCWYQLIDQLICNQYNMKEICKLPKSKRKVKIEKLKEVAIIQSSMLSQKMGKHNRALYILDGARIQLDDLECSAFHFRTYYKRFYYQMEIKLIYNTRKENVINSYAKQFMDFQLKIIKMKDAIRQSLNTHVSAWRELTKNQPDEEKVLKAIRESYQNNIIVNETVNSLLKISPQVLPIAFPIYHPYFKSVCNLEIPKPKKQVITIERLSQDLNNYSYDSKTATCMVKILNTEQFGNIVYNNMYFEQFIGFAKNSQSKLHYDDLVPQPFQVCHRRKQLAFIQSGGFLIQNAVVLIRNKSGYIMDASMTVQIHPSLKQGLMAEVFFFPKLSANPQSLVICNQRGQFFYYSKPFQTNVIGDCQQCQIQNLNQTFRFFVSKHRQNENESQRQICVGFQASHFQIFLRRKIFDEQKNEYFYVIRMTRIVKQTYQVDSIQQEESRRSVVINIQKSNQTQAEKPENYKLQVNQNLKKQRVQNKKNSYSKQEDKDEQQRLKLKKEDQILQEKLNTITKRKSSSKIQIWTIAKVLVICAILSLMAYNISLVNDKVKIFKDSSLLAQRYQKINILLEDAFFNLRKANIIANTSDVNQPASIQKYNYYRGKFMEANLIAVDHYSYLMEKQKIALTSYTFSDSNQKIEEQASDFFQILEYQIFAGLTNLAEGQINTNNYPITVSQISKPFDNYKINFIEANLNGLRQIFPNFRQIKDNVKRKIYCTLGFQECISNQHVNFVTPIFIGLTLLMFAFSFYLSAKIRIIKGKTFEMIEKLPYKVMQERKKRILTYKIQQFPTIKAKRQESEESVFKADQKYRNRVVVKALQQFQNRCANQILTKSVISQAPFTQLSKKAGSGLFQFQSPANFESVNSPSGLALNTARSSVNSSRLFNANTNRGFIDQQNTNDCGQSMKIKATQKHKVMLQQTDRSKNSDPLGVQNSNIEDINQLKEIDQGYQKMNRSKNGYDAKKFISIQFTKPDSKIICCKYGILIVPLVGLSLSILLSFFQATQSFVTYLQNQNLLYEQMRVVKQIKLYTLELGLDDGIKRINQTSSIGDNLKDIIAQMYKVQRQILNRFLDQKSLQSGRLISQTMNQLNEKSVCSRLNELPIDKKQPYLNEASCGNLFGKQYLKQGRRAALIGFLQDARILWQKNVACQPCDFAHRQKFIANQTLELMRILEFYFEAISNYQIDMHKGQLIQKQRGFQISIYIQLGFLLVMVLITMLVFGLCFRKQIYSDIIDIKSVIHLLSNELIKNDAKLRTTVLSEIDYDFLK